MKRILILIAAVMVAMPALNAADYENDETQGPRHPKKEQKTSAVKQELQNHFSFYGFIRNYFAYDTRESTAGTADLFYYLPKDHSYPNGDKDFDENAQGSFRFLSLTTRLGVDVSGYRVGRTDFGAKVETDFYSGLTGSTGTAQLRLRQAYATIGWGDLSLGQGTEKKAYVKLTIGQAWHPMAADQPHVTSLETGAPFNCFSRTPEVIMDASLGKRWTITGAAIWQMQYAST
ncbi:MAG: DcaP family trimeric outer membrane transporter, partial [Bacteroidales bacterium]|nr:DcaP family trimeric outer membrane transporter [Bacteroidales bacterium]